MSTLPLNSTIKPPALSPFHPYGHKGSCRAYSGDCDSCISSRGRSDAEDADVACPYDASAADGAPPCTCKDALKRCDRGHRYWCTECGYGVGGMSSVCWNVVCPYYRYTMSDLVDEVMDGKVKLNPVRAAVRVQALARGFTSRTPPQSSLSSSAHPVPGMAGRPPASRLGYPRTPPVLSNQHVRSPAGAPNQQPHGGTTSPSRTRRGS